MATGHVLSAERKAELKQERATTLTEREEARKEEQTRSMKRAYAIWMNAEKVDPEHPYLQGKEIDVSAFDIRQDKDGNLIIPGYSLETRRIQTLEYISKDGAKWYEKGCPKAGAVCLSRRENENRSEDNDGKEIVLMTEGFATGASVHAATGLTVAVAFDAGNLKEAAMAIKKAMPNADITICADNDHNRPDGKNIGVIKAKEAAAEVGCNVTVANFEPDEKGKGMTDFNDLHKSRGLGAVKEQVEKGIFVEQAQESEAER